MTAFLIAWAAGVLAIIALAVALPCKGCRLRRERFRRAYEELKKKRSGP